MDDSVWLEVFQRQSSLIVLVLSDLLQEVRMTTDLLREVPLPKEIPSTCLLWQDWQITPMISQMVE